MTERVRGIELFCTKKAYNHLCRLGKNLWQGFVCRNQTLTEEILMGDTELSQLEDEIQEIRELLSSPGP